MLVQLLLAASQREVVLLRGAKNAIAAILSLAFTFTSNPTSDKQKMGEMKNKRRMIED